MLSSPVYTETHPHRSAAFPSRMNLRGLVPAATGYSVCKLVIPVIPTDICIPFLFNRSASHRLRRGPTGSLLSPFLSSPCRHFHSQQGGTPPLPPSSSTVPSPICSISRRPSHFASTTYKMLLPQILCIDNDPFSWGVYTPLSSSSGRSSQRKRLPTGSGASLQNR
jgi:hypothetical protein